MSLSEEDKTQSMAKLESEEDKTHNQWLSSSPRSKFLDELAISDGVFFLVLQWIFLNLFP